MAMAMLGGDGGNWDNQIYRSPPSPPHASQHLLEVTIMSAQDLHPATWRMATYASAWVDPDHKLRTHVDSIGRANPSWNDKFVFRIDDSFLRADTSAVTVEICAASAFGSDSVVGTCRVVLSSLKPSTTTRCVALQVRRPRSLRPQGIINVGVSLLDGYLDSMPLDPAFVLKDIMDTPGRSSPSSHNSKASEGSGMEWNRGYSNGNGEEWKMGRNQSLEMSRLVGVQEEEELESKLEKWRMDLSPSQDMPKKHRRSWTLPCACTRSGFREG